MAETSEVKAMEELAKQMWERYFKQKVVSDLLNHSLDGYKAEVISNNGNGTLTVRRPFDEVSMTLKCPPALATSAQAGDQVLVVTLGDMSNAFILCKTDLTGLGGGGEVLRPSEYDFSDIDANDTFTETVGSGETAVTTTYEVTRDNSGRINKITNLDDGWETDVDWGAEEPPGIPAAEVTYDNTSSGLSATDVQDAIDELAQGGGGGGPSPATNTPLMDGTGAVGTSLKYAREDHEHPTDTSRASATGLSNHVGDTNNPHQVTAAQTGAVPTGRKINGYDLSADRTLTASDVGAQPTVNVSGILKGDGSGGISAAVAGTDYQTPLVAGTDYATPAMIPSVPSPSDAAPQDLAASASAGSSGDYSRADHAHKKPSAADIGAYVKPSGGIPASDLASGVIPTVPDPSDATPQALGTAAAGSSGDYSRADHVHNMPSASDVGALASDGTAVAASTLAAQYSSGAVAAGWYQVLTLTISAGQSRNAVLLISDSYTAPVGLLAIRFNRTSGGAGQYTVQWLATTIAIDDVRYIYDSTAGTLTLYFYKRTNTNGRVNFRVLLSTTRTGTSVDLTGSWSFTAVTEPPTGAVAATGDSKLQTGTITLSATWSGSGPYTQTVTVTGPTITNKSKVDIQPDPTQFAALVADGVTGYIVENNAGTVTLYMFGASPTTAMTVQCTVEETV